MKLSAHFTLEELIHSDTAVRLGLNNQPNARAVASLRALCFNVLQPMRDHFGVPIEVTSGYRSWAVNKRVGGAPNSSHLFGEAVDFKVMGTPADQIFDWVAFGGVVPFDKAIMEFGRWVHVAYTERAPNRGYAYHATKNRRGRTLYKRIYRPLTS